MEEDRAKKIEAGREKLAAYKKKKQKRGKRTPENSPSHSSDSSISLNVSLPDNANGKDADDVSDSSTISEHLNSGSSRGVEHDRSLQEIEVSNSSFSLILHNLPENDEAYRLSQENLLASPLYSSDKTDTIVADKVSGTVVNDVQGILNDILHSEHFKSKNDNDKSDSVDTNELSINIFEGVSLDDSSINNYVTKLRQTNLSDANDEEFSKLLTSEEVNLVNEHSFEKIKELEKELVRKDSEIAALSAELDSLKELTSSLTTTDYKPYQEEYHNRLVEFQNAVVHRDNLIQQLTESLQQSILNREELQQQSENFAKEIALLQKQLSETSNIIKQHRCTMMEFVERSPTKSSSSNSVREARRTAAKMDDDSGAVSESRKGDNNLFGGDDLPKQPIPNLEEECAKLEETLGAGQVLLLHELKEKINVYIQHYVSESNRRLEGDIKQLKQKLSTERTDYEAEMGKLRQLLSDIKEGSPEFAEMKKVLDAKHAKEMEELRTYFEKKCADLEKNYSEEVFSQQSRKMSDSSTCSELNSEMGPGGDAAPPSDIEQRLDPSRLDLKSLSNDDLLKIRDDLTRLGANLAEIDFNRLSKGELKKIKTDLANSNLRLLAKYDWSEIRKDVQNKYHAELEILREDYDNRMDLLHVEHDVKMRNTKESYQEQIDALKFELNEALRSAQMSVSTAVQEVASSGEYELAEVVQSYERRLQEQVTLAKIDIIAALEHQIQVLAGGEVDSEWPTELLQIRNRFTERYEEEIEEMKARHAQEVAQLKAEHFKVLNGALERARRRSLREGESLTDKDVEIIKDRDNLKKNNSILRHLLGELLMYFTRCEDELNKTFVEEIVKYGFDKNVSQIENELNVSIDSSSSKDSDAFNLTKRVHFTPNFTDLMNMVEASNAGDLDSKDLSLDLKNRLGSCLERLRSDANAILALTVDMRNKNTEMKTDNGPKTTPDAKNASELEETILSLTRQMIADSQLKGELAVELEDARKYAKSLESERVSLENHVQQLVDKQRVLERDLLDANKKIADLIECGHKEIVSEGYGQDHRNSSLGGKVANLAELQEKARTLVAEWKNGADHPLIQLVEELCREGERITEEAKRDKDDLRQQVDQPIDILDSWRGVKIEAADRKLRATCSFLEEQAMEREMERDESQKEIAALKDQLKEREKERETCELLGKEVEQLELQMREMTKLIELGEQKREEVENERKEAVDKIWVLRDIIRDLEYRVEAKAEVETELKKLVAELEDVIEQQTRAIDESNRQLEERKGDVDAHLLKERIVYLENEAQKLRLNSELAGGEGALKELQSQLNQFESSIDKKTKDLEGLHCAISTTSCSSPSEDMSIRDQIRPQTPSVREECDIPLQQLARLKEKLVKHSRAEEAAVKRIRDLEMQLTNAKHELEETQNEKEILQNQVTEQIVLLSSLQMRLDEQRLKAEHNQRQANSSLEVRIYDLENEVQTLKEAIHCKEKTIKHLNKVVEETKMRLEAREKELSSKEEDETVVKLRKEIELLGEENRLLKEKIDSDAQNAQILPSLVDNIIADKNSSIDKLTQQLSDLQKQYEEYQSLNLDLEQLKQLSQLVTSERALSDILSLMNLSARSVEQARKIETPSESLTSPIDLAYARNPNETTLFGAGKECFQPEISTIERVGSPNVNFTVDAPLIKPNSTEICKSIEKKVHFGNSTGSMDEIKRQVAEKDEIIREYAEKLKVLEDLEGDIEKLRQHLGDTEDDLRKATETFENEKKANEEAERSLRIELAEKKMHLTEKNKQLELFEEDNKRKDEMYMALMGEKREIESKLVDFQRDFDAIMEKKNKEIYRLEEQLAKLLESCVALEEAESKMRSKEDELEQLKAKYGELESELVSKCEEFEDLQAKYHNQSEDNRKLGKELKNKSEQLDSLTSELDIIKSELHVKNKQLADLDLSISDRSTSLKAKTDEEIKRLKTLLVDRECELEILNEDVVRYQNEIAKLEEEEAKKKQTGTKMESKFELQSMKLQKQIAERNLEILKMRTVQDDLNKEIQHLQDHLQEKDRVIEQMKADTKSLHANLETIQNKIQETGNIVDLRKRLHEEQHLNAILREEVETLKSSAENNADRRSLSIEDITGQVRKQLDYSAHLDSNILQALSSGDELNDPNDDAPRESSNRQQEIFVLEELERAKKDLEARLELEREQLREEVDCLNERNEGLLLDLKAAKRVRNESEANLKYTRDMLRLKTDELAKVEAKVVELRKDEVALKEESLRFRVELEQKLREVENSRELMGELEKERHDMKRQLHSMSDKIEEMERERRVERLAHQQKDAGLTSTVPDRLLNKMKELTDSLKIQMDENKVLMDTLSKMTTERSHLLEKIRTLEDHNTYKLPFDDPTSRANHLFGKYLRSESYRKALIWQKRYLVALLATYQSFKPITERLPLSAFEPRHREPTKSKGKRRFKCGAITIIAIVRMKYMVQRWHSGRRMATRSGIPHANPPTSSTQFQVGQPVSSQNFHTPSLRTDQEAPRAHHFSRSPIHLIGQFEPANTRCGGDGSRPPRSHVDDPAPWTGLLPEPQNDRLRMGATNFAHAHAEHLAPLETPNVLSYFKRFNEIQRRLGMTFDNLNS